MCTYMHSMYGYMYKGKSKYANELEIQIGKITDLKYIFFDLILL